MQADIYNLGTTFYKLVAIRDTELREDVTNYDGEDTYLLDCYTLAGDGDYLDKEDLGVVTLERVGCCAVIGSATGEVRCYVRDITAYRDAQGDLWMDAELHDEVFC
jgi:hypothetical protein